MGNDDNKQLDSVVGVLEGYYGYRTDYDLLCQSVSGGASSVLGELIINSGGIVVGVGYTLDYCTAEYLIATELEELMRLKGSKYIPANKKVQYKGQERIIYDVVGELLQENKRVLFVGLGCEVGALKKYLEQHNIDDNELYTVDLICHGPTLEIVQKKYVEQLQKNIRVM